MTILALRRYRRLSALLAFVAAMQLVLAPARRLCGGTQPARQHASAHAMSHDMSHQMAHGTSRAPAPANHDDQRQGDDQCLIMRGCEAIAVAAPVLLADASPAHAPWPVTELPHLQSVDRAPDAPPPRG